MGQVQTFEQHALNELGLTMDYGSPAPKAGPNVLQPEVGIRRASSHVYRMPNR